jgi:hypothetical protein
VLDLLIRGGWVADGTGNPRYPAALKAGSYLRDVVARYGVL